MDISVRPHGGMSARLLLSMSGIDDETVDDCARFRAELTARGVPLSLLVAPRPPRGAGLRRAAGWIAERCLDGDALLLHGYDHMTPAGAPRLGGRRAEFAALPAHEARLRLTAATAMLERYGLRTDLFAPPRWLASLGTLAALPSSGFTLCATAAEVRDLRTGHTHRGRVLGLAPGLGWSHGRVLSLGLSQGWSHSLGRGSGQGLGLGLGRGRGEGYGPGRGPGQGLGQGAEPWRCRALLLGTAALARRGGLLRLTVDAAELGRPASRQAILDAVGTALHHGATPATYRDLTHTPSTHLAA